ncbi:MAG: [ribosomal protein S5]-alanine N-acetyltransferase [Actinomycetota bacterium]|jgi:RimJ/RimL family protein N-acetyltransferase|nr:[ribosomal protein S5]-alanine N-acetyltransferase [Actinomycetota bacterium]
MSIVLRRWDETDAEWYVEAIADEAIQRFTNEGAVSVDDMRAAIARLRDRDGVFAIADAATAAPIGNIGWVRSENDRARAEGYYWVDAAARGRGVAVAALGQLWELARREGIESLRLTIDADNVASRRAAARAGYVPTGDGEPRVYDDVRHDTVVYARDS